MLVRWAEGAAPVGDLVEVDEDFAVAELDRVAGDGEAVRVVGVVAGADVEGPAMGGAHDDRARELALAQREGRVGTTVLHGMHGVAEAEETDLDRSQLDAQTTSVGDVAKFCCALKSHGAGV